MSQKTTDHDLIRNCIAKYCLGIDLRNWNLFSEAFVDDVKAYYPEPTGAIEGIAAFKASVESTLGSLPVYHGISTQLIELTGDKTAKATTYCRTDIFGEGDNKGKIATNWSTFEQKLVKGPSAQGREDWKIAEHTVVEKAMAGDLSIFAK
ncbi:hypothetical protein ACHAQA_002774 [Verticillium albo-atrum]